MAQTYLASGRTGEAERLLKQVVAAAPQRKNELLILGDLYIRTANYQEAKIWLEKAEHLEPAAQTELLLAIASQHLKQMDQAAHYLELAKGRAPNNPDVQRAFAAFYRDTGDYDKAVSSLLGIRNPKPDVVAELAFTYGLAGRPEESARTYAQAADAMPRDLTLQLSAAQAQVGIASFDRAEEFLQRASRLDANYYRLHAIRGQIAQIQDRDEDAAHEFSAAIAALPPTPIEGPLYGIQLHMDLIPLYKNLNQPDQARQELASAQKLIGSLDERGSDRAAFLRLRAVIHSESGEYEAALSDMKESLALTPNDPNSLQLNGDVLMKLGRTSEAIAVFQQVLKLDPRNRFALTSLGVPQVLREEERYFNFMGDYRRSADLGHQAIKMVPRDREVIVYLGYDLLHLQLFDELQTLTTNNLDVLPKDADVPLLAGYVYKHNGQREEAVKSFTESLKRDPKVATAYTNRGFVYNDLRKPALAAADFEAALKIKPDDADTHMGLAFAELNLGHPKAAIEQTQLAEAIAGDSKMIHVVRATAYGRQGALTKSTQEYRAALQFDPDDGSLNLGLANILMAQRRYREALEELQNAREHLPKDASLYAVMARANAELHNHDEAMRDVDLAEQYAVAPASPDKTNADDSDAQDALADIYVSTGEALGLLGQQDAAMNRFSKALGLHAKDRVGVRLAVAKNMAKQGRTEDAERQIALAQMEVDAKDADPPSGEQYIAMASVLQQLHEYELSETYLERAKAAGAPDTSVRITLANSYLALGETRRAAAELAAVKQVEDSEVDYQYLLAQASLYQQEHRSAETLSSFAAAASDAGEDPTAEQRLLEAGGTEGYRVNPKISLLSNLVVQPIFEDSTVYVLDSKLNSPAGPVSSSDVANLPPPRSSVETNLLNSFNLHLASLPTTSGFFQVRNAQGTISVPATRSVVQRNTTDYALNFGIDPTLHLGSNVVSLNSGIQGTVRRDTRSPVQMNQNLFRVFTYASTSSFFNALSADGFFSAEFGSFTDTPITERLLSGAINFRVGMPWGKTALITGWKTTDQRFDSSQLGNSRNFYTSTYIGLSRRFSSRFSAEAIAEDLRSWRSQPYSPIHSAISQALRPAASIRYSPTTRWEMQASSSYELTRGFHVYDMIQNSFTVSYVRPLERNFNESTGAVRLKYPIRLAAGVRTQNFPNFTQGPSQKLVPFFSLTIF
ncbi:tetratricopeptide repeat protein [Terriglobus sp. YAF25]|uniref:tetratricopeptide repeat protein n=1 Tax=Terriglobus sp. YAF25 TaxID=3233080 RepID=UPI003F9AEB59